MPMQGGLSIERMCELARDSRAGFYRSLRERASGEEDVEVRSVIQRTALEHRRRYGLPTSDSRTATPRDAGKPQAGLAHDA
jgi:hypothetical protein